MAAYDRGIILFRRRDFTLSLPKWGSLKAGKAAENTWNSRLVEALHKVGVESAEFERIFTVRKEGKDVQSKPDISFKNGGVHIVSGKFGARKELEAYKSADEYKEDLEPALKRLGAKIGEVFAVTYPASKGEKFYLHILPREGHPEISLALDTLEEVASQIHTAVQGLITELEKRQEPVLDEARRLLRWGAEDLAITLKGVSLSELEAIFGGHTFFESLLRPRLQGEMRAHALRLGAAYLLVNQVLFYVLLSHEAERAGPEVRSRYPSIQVEHFASPAKLQDEYFQRVRAKNYEPVYGFEVGQFFKGEAAEHASDAIVRGILGLAPKLDVPDLMGQVFQSLIPLEIRKPLGAHYTNPRAATLLARLAVRTENDMVLDPACGSGTLLVASYRRKRALSTDMDAKALHHKFVEKDITGIDAMGFVAHLAAVNLALQQPLAETDHVRIGTADSTAKRPNDLVKPTEAALPREFQQVNLEHGFDRAKHKKSKGVVRTSRKEPKPFQLDPVDLVIMNPPFTSWDNMGKSYREALKKSWAQERSDYREAIYWKVSQQAFFLLLADRFLKDGGRIAAVLPVTTLTGVAFEPLVKFFLSRYTIRYIVVGLGRSSFSEDTSLAECLIVMDKTAPPQGHKFRLVGTILPPDEWTDDEMQIAAEAAESGASVKGRIIVRDHPQEELRLDRETLSGFTLRLVPEFDSARDSVDKALRQSKVPIVALETCRGAARNIETSRWVLGGGWLVHFGSSALFGYRRAQRAVKKKERLVFVRQENEFVTLEDRYTRTGEAHGHLYKFPAGHVLPALRRLSFLPSPDATHESDFVITTRSRTLEEAYAAFYGAKEAKTYLKRINEAKKNWKGGRWAALVNKGMCKVCIAGRLNLAAPGTTVLSCRSEQPLLLAAYGFMVRGLESDREEKLFVLWLNSTVSLLSLLSRLTITEGSWVRMEQFVLARLPAPDFSSLTEDQWRAVELLYGKVCGTALPSLVAQLQGNPTRRTLDDGILTLLGVASTERAILLDRMQEGARTAIKLLATTMHKARRADELQIEPQEEEGDDVAE